MKSAHLFVLLFASLIVESGTNSHAAAIRIHAKDTSIYDTWLPENGNTLELLVSVTGAPSEGEIQFHFTEVSNWPGTCMNAGTGTKQDLCIYNEQTTSVFASVGAARAENPLSPINTNHLTWETRTDGTTEARFSWTSDAKLPGTFTISVTVTSEDFGAFGTLRARLYKKGWLFGIKPIDENDAFNIPKDVNLNNIADAWEVFATGWTRDTTPTTDAEAGANDWHGDGFVAYEEYRGFEVNGVHKRLKLNRKDVFVHSEFDKTFYPSLLSEDEVKLGPATNDAGEPQNGFPAVFKVWFIAHDEMDRERIVNFNECIRHRVFEYWRVAQKAIHIERNEERKYQPGAPWGEAYVSTDYATPHTHRTHTHTHGGVPHDVFDTWPQHRSGDTIVYTRQIRGEAGEDVLTSANSKTALYTKALGNTVSHEFAHHLGLADHDWTHIVREHPSSTPQKLVPSSVYNNHQAPWNYQYIQNGSMDIMFYSHHIDDGSGVFHTGAAISPQAGIQLVAGEGWTRAVQCAGRPHHDDKLCQNVPHWIACDVHSSQNWGDLSGYGVKWTSSPKQTPLPKRYTAGDDTPTLSSLSFIGAGPYDARTPIIARVDFRRSVDVEQGVRLLLNVGGNRREAYPMLTADGTHITETARGVMKLFFRYAVRSTDVDTDGVTLWDADTATAGIQPFTDDGTVLKMTWAGAERRSAPVASVPRLPCGIHPRGTAGAHHWVSACAVTNAAGQRCTQPGGDSACTPHRHTFPQAMHACAVHPQTTGGSHAYGRCNARQNGQRCTGYRYACLSHRHTFPSPPTPTPIRTTPTPSPVVRCPADAWTNCRGTRSHAAKCRKGHLYYTCNPDAVAHHKHRQPVRCPADAWTNCRGTRSHAAKCRKGHLYYTCNPDAVVYHKH